MSDDPRTGGNVPALPVQTTHTTMSTSPFAFLHPPFIFLFLASFLRSQHACFKNKRVNYTLLPSKMHYIPLPSYVKIYTSLP